MANVCLYGQVKLSCRQVKTSAQLVHRQIISAKVLVGLDNKMFKLMSRPGLALEIHKVVERNQNGSLDFPDHNTV
jgi:hypothetical protein